MQNRISRLDFLQSGMEATLGLLPTISAAAKDPASHDLIILGAPARNIRIQDDKPNENLFNATRRRV
jgi:hypothetical protein